MQKKFNALKTAFINGRSSRKNFILTVVALVEIIMIMVVSTVAWVETTSSLEIRGTGNIDTITYTTANIGSGSDYNDKNIDLSGYFRSAGNVHLAPASSADGNNIFFPVAAKAGTTTDTYRKGNVDDKNVNYISFAFDLKAATSTCNFYFAKKPTIKIGDESVTNNDVRIAITALGKTTIYSNTEDKEEEVVSSVDGTKSVTAVESFDNHVDSDSAPDNTELFEVKSGATERIVISLWLQEPEDSSIYAGKTVTVEDFELVAGSVKVSFVDSTTGFNGPVSSTDATEANAWHWVNNNTPQLLIYDGEKSYLMSQDADFDTNYTWITRIPQTIISDSEKTLYFCRCVKGTQSISGLNDSNVYNYWVADVSDAISKNSVVYTAYGATQTGGKIGYGTWGDVIQIQLDTEDQAVLPTPANSINATAVTLTNTSNSDIVCQMNYHDNLWIGFVPADGITTSFKFSFTTSDTERIITAANRDTTETISKFVVTSAKTGYWNPPAIVAVHSNNENFGTVSVSGGADNATSVKVTQGATVTLNASPNEGYELEGWYSDAALTTRVVSTTSEGATTVKAPAKNITNDYYAKFEIKTFKVEAYAYTDGTNSSTGGTVKVSTSSSSGAVGASSSLTVDYGTSVTYTATNASGYTFDGWYNSATGGTRVSTSAAYTKTITSSENAALYARFTAKNRVYFANNVVDSDSYSSDKQWQTPYCYVWQASNTSNNNAWPGKAMSYDSDLGLYYYDITTSNVDKVIFSAGNNQPQTVDLDLTIGAVYYLQPKSDGNYPATTDGSDGDTVTYYFTNSKSWSGTIYCYAWNDSGDNNSAYPGVAMDLVGNNGYGQAVYKIELDTSKYTMVIFNNGSTDTKTGNIKISDFNGKNQCYLDDNGNVQFTNYQ